MIPAIYRYGFAALAAAGLSACVETPGGETHFLEPCDSHEACGEGWACVCGACTIGCFNDASCADTGVPSVCVTESIPVLYGACTIEELRAPGVCLAACEEDAECGVYGLGYCVDGACASAPKVERVVVPDGELAPTAGPVGTGTAPVYAADQGQLFLAGPGHLLRSTDGGRSWGEVADGQALDIAASGGALVAVFADSGVSRSVDGGGSWDSAAGTGAPGEIFSVHAGAGRFWAIAGGKDVAERSAILVSDDAGASWSTLAPLPNGEAVGEVFAAAEDVVLATGLYSGTLYRSSDAGATWSAVEAGRTGWSTTFAASGGELFAMAPGSASVFRSSDRGLTWSEMVLSSFESPALGLPSLVAAGDELFAGLGSGTVYRWDPALTRWVEATAGLRGGRITALAGGSAGLWLGADELLYRWSRGSRRWEAVDLTLVETRVVALAEEAGTLLASSGGDAVHRSFDGGASWTRTGSGLPTNSQVVQLGLHGGVAYASTAQHGIFVAHDAENWSAANNGVPQLPGVAGTPVVVTAFVGLDVEVFAATADVVQGGTVGRGVLRSSDGGATWKAARAGLPKVRRAGLDEESYEAIVSLRVHDGVLLAAAAESGVYRSEDGGESWTHVGEGLPGAPQALAVVGDALVAAIPVEAGRTTVIFRSTDGGATWSKAGEVSELPGRVQAFVARDTLLAASTVDEAGEQAGLFLSSDEGASWDRAGADTGVAPGPLAAGHDALFVGTSQAGVWRLGLSELPIGP